MISWLGFISVGLLFGAIGEGINNFVVGIQGVSAIGNFLFAIIFYCVTLSGAFWYAKKYLTLTRKSLVQYFLIFGIGVGLFFNEWIVVGNHPFNPAVAHPLSQLGMVAFHGVMYCAPALLYIGSITKKNVLVAFLYIGAWATIPRFILFSNQPEDILTAAALAGTYFIGYIPVLFWILFKIKTSNLSK